MKFSLKFNKPQHQEIGQHVMRGFAQTTQIINEVCLMTNPMVVLFSRIFPSLLTIQGTKCMMEKTQ